MEYLGIGTGAQLVDRQDPSRDTRNKMSDVRETAKLVFRLKRISFEQTAIVGWYYREQGGTKWLREGDTLELSLGQLGSNYDSTEVLIGAALEINKITANRIITTLQTGHETEFILEPGEQVTVHIPQYDFTSDYWSEYWSKQ